MDDFLDIFEELNEYYLDDKQKAEEIKRLNSAAKKEMKNDIDSDFEKAWSKLNIPTSTCIMKPADFKKMMKKVGEFRW